jgi:hypothetical protein
MWPNRDDVRRVFKTLKSPTGTPESTYQDVVLTQSLVLEAVGLCRNRGRWEFRPIESVKKFAELFLGRELSDTVIIIALRMNGLELKPSRSDSKVLLVKIPLFDKFSEVQQQWKQHQVKVEKEIDAEVQRWKTSKNAERKLKAA